MRLFHILIPFMLIISIWSTSANQHILSASSDIQQRSSLAIGYEHICALTSRSGVICSGSNFYGELGNGEKPTNGKPVDVDGLSSGVIAITAGYNYTCALTSSGGVKCWGENDKGQLGDGTKSTRYTPVDVSGLTSGVVAITSGYAHTCALTSSASVKCWGWNAEHQVSDDYYDHLIPVDVHYVDTLHPVAIYAGAQHTCAITDTNKVNNHGGVTCWGFDGSNNVSSSRPFSHAIDSLAGGLSFTCAVTTSGGVSCYGTNNYGQLGNGTTTSNTLPGDVPTLSSGITALTAGRAYACALTSSGAVLCWGENTFGQLGDGTTIQRETPTPVNGLNGGVLALVTEPNGDHTCAVMQNGRVKCWGTELLQLGAPVYQTSTPVDIPDITVGVDISPNPTPTVSPTPTPDPNRERLIQTFLKLRTAVKQSLLASTTRFAEIQASYCYQRDNADYMNVVKATWGIVDLRLTGRQLIEALRTQGLSVTYADLFDLSVRVANAQSASGFQDDIARILNRLFGDHTCDGHQSEEAVAAQFLNVLKSEPVYTFPDDRVAVQGLNGVFQSIDIDYNHYIAALPDPLPSTYPTDRLISQMEQQILQLQASTAYETGVTVFTRDSCGEVHVGYLSAIADQMSELAYERDKLSDISYTATLIGINTTALQRGLTIVGFTPAGRAIKIAVIIGSSSGITDYITSAIAFLLES